MVGGLIFAIGLFVSSNKDRLNELKEQVSTLESKLQKEVDYGKLQDNNNIKLINDVNYVLTLNSKTLEGLQLDIVKDISPIIKDNNQKLVDIKSHLNDGRA